MSRTESVPVVSSSSAVMSLGHGLYCSSSFIGSPASFLYKILYLIALLFSSSCGVAMPDPGFSSRPVPPERTGRVDSEGIMYVARNSYNIRSVMYFGQEKLPVQKKIKKSKNRKGTRLVSQEGLNSLLELAAISAIGCSPRR